MFIDIAVIVGAASGVIVFNFILVTWCIFFQRRREAKVESQAITLQRHSSLLEGKRVKFAASVKGSQNRCPASGRKLPYYAPSPLASAKIRTRRSDRPRTENLSPQTTVPNAMGYVPSVCSDDTASVYSTASAPLEVHDHLLRSHNSPSTIPVALASSRDAHLMFAENSLSAMEEGLNPETRNPIIQQHPRQADLWWRQQRSLSCEFSPDHSALGHIPNRSLPPGLVVSPPPTAKNTRQSLSSTLMPSPYSP